MADKSPSFYQASISIAKKAFTALVTALLMLSSDLLVAIKINFLDKLRKPEAASSISSCPQGFFVITEVLLISSNNTSHSAATPTNTSSVMYYYTESLPASNGDTHFSRITISPSASPSPSSSSSLPDSPPTPICLQLTFLPAGLPLTGLPTEKTFAEDPAVGELIRITFMQVPNPNPASSNQIHALSAFQKSDLSKVIFAVVAPVTGGILALMFNYSPQLYSTLPHWFMPFVICTLSFGSTLIIHGILFREKLPRFASALEELGFLIILLGFCSLVTTIIPKNVVWAPWSCYVFTLLALAVLRFHEAASGSSTTSAR